MLTLPSPNKQKSAVYYLHPDYLREQPSILPGIKNILTCDVLMPFFLLDLVRFKHSGHFKRLYQLSTETSLLKERARSSIVGHQVDSSVGVTSLVRVSPGKKVTQG